jgi:hypothetical protein
MVVPSSWRLMSSAPSQADQWSSRWPSTRIAYVVGAVFMKTLQLAEDLWAVWGGDGRGGDGRDGG